jgi:hypothetical protein
MDPYLQTGVSFARTITIRRNRENGEMEAVNNDGYRLVLSQKCTTIIIVAPASLHQAGPLWQVHRVIPGRRTRERTIWW